MFYYYVMNRQVYSLSKRYLCATRHMSKGYDFLSQKVQIVLENAGLKRLMY